MGSIALVTGAGSGFGALTSVLLAEKGWTVYAGVRDLSRAEELLSLAGAAGVAESIRTIPLDVTDGDQIRQAVERMRAESGRIDALVNNAGFAAGGFVEETPIGRWREQFDTNFFGLVELTQAVIPVMRGQGGGRVVLISSVSGRIGFPSLGPYVASKHAVEGFGETLRLELAGFGIPVSIIEPGPYRTPIWKKSFSAVKEPGDDSPYKQLYARLKPMLDSSAQGGGDPKLVAETIYRALTDKKPKLRYLPGAGERRMLAAKKWLPWSVIEKAALKMLGVRGKR